MHPQQAADGDDNAETIRQASLAPAASRNYRSGMEERPAAIIVDDEEAVRSALENLFRSVGIASSSFATVPDFLSSGERQEGGCLILDVRLPDISGLDFQDQLAQRKIGLPVILMTGHGDIAMSVRAMKAGAVDFLTKPFREQDMLDAVNRAFEIDRQRRVLEQSRQVLRHRFASLSPREKQVMALVTAGRMNKQVAGQLRLSEITVKIHRGAAMRKMEATSLAALVRMAGELESELKAFC